METVAPCQPTHLGLNSVRGRPLLRYPIAVEDSDLLVLVYHTYVRCHLTANLTTDISL